MLFRSAPVYEAIQGIIKQHKNATLNLPTLPGDVPISGSPNFPWSAYHSMPFTPAGISLGIESKAGYDGALKQAIQDIKDAGMKVLVTVAHSGFSAGGPEVMEKLLNDANIDYIVPQLYVKGDDVFCNDDSFDSKDWSKFKVGADNQNTKILAGISVILEGKTTPTTKDDFLAKDAKTGKDECKTMMDNVDFDGVMYWSY